MACQPAEMAAAVGVLPKDGFLVVHQLNYMTLRALVTGPKPLFFLLFRKRFVFCCEKQ
jgi:hypothetical protein